MKIKSEYNLVFDVLLKKKTFSDIPMSERQKFGRNLVDFLSRSFESNRSRFLNCDPNHVYSCDFCFFFRHIFCSLDFSEQNDLLFTIGSSFSRISFDCYPYLSIEIWINFILNGFQKISDLPKNIKAQISFQLWKDLFLKEKVQFHEIPEEYQEEIKNSFERNEFYLGESDENVHENLEKIYYLIQGLEKNKKFSYWTLKNRPSGILFQCYSILCVNFMAFLSFLVSDFREKFLSMNFSKNKKFVFRQEAKLLFNKFFERFKIGQNLLYFEKEKFFKVNSDLILNQILSSSFSGQLVLLNESEKKYFEILTLEELWNSFNKLWY